MQNNLRNRYGGAQSIVEQGRIESQRLLMERYRRIELGQNEIGGSGLDNIKSNRPNYYAHYYAGGVPPSQQQNMRHQYIPMSQKGQRPHRQ